MRVDNQAGSGAGTKNRRGRGTAAQRVLVQYKRKLASPFHLIPHEFEEEKSAHSGSVIERAKAVTPAGGAKKKSAYPFTGDEVVGGLPTVSEDQHGNDTSSRRLLC